MIMGVATKETKKDRSLGFNIFTIYIPEDEV